MAVPKIVEKQLAEAEALQASLQQAADSGPSVLTETSQFPAPQPPQEAAEPAAPTPPPPSPTPAPPQENWEQRFRTLQGMFNSQVPTLQGQVRTYESQVATLTEQVRALTAAMQAVKPAEPQRPSMDPEDVEKFGSDLVGMTQRYISQAIASMRQEFGSVVTDVERRVREIEEAVKGVSTKTDTSMERVFFSSLDRLVPDWQQINQDERWRSWLAEIDQVYGVPRQAALDAGYRNLDADRVAAVFQAYKASLPAARPPSMAPLVTPPSGGGNPPPPAQPRQKPLLAQKFVQEYYLDLARGRYRGREADAQRIEAEINEAAAEGRIV